MPQVSSTFGSLLTGRPPSASRLFISSLVQRGGYALLAGPLFIRLRMNAHRNPLHRPPPLRRLAGDPDGRAEPVPPSGFSPHPTLPPVYELHRFRAFGLTGGTGGGGSNVVRVIHHTPASSNFRTCSRALSWLSQ